MHTYFSNNTNTVHGYDQSRGSGDCYICEIACKAPETGTGRPASVC